MDTKRKTFNNKMMNIILIGIKKNYKILLIENEFERSKDWLNYYLMPQNSLKLFHLLIRRIFTVDFILDKN